MKSSCLRRTSKIVSLTLALVIFAAPLRAQEPSPSPSSQRPSERKRNLRQHPRSNRLQLHQSRRLIRYFPPTVTNSTSKCETWERC